MENVLQVLTTISEIVSERNRDGRNLWDIMSALRGPDFDVKNCYKLSDTLTIDCYDLKEATTAVIRYNMGVARDNAKSVISHPDSEEYVRIRSFLEMSDIPYHFIAHSIGAFEALGLKWNEVNPDLRGEISYVR